MTVAAGGPPVCWTAACEDLVLGSGVPSTLLQPGRSFSDAHAWARFLAEPEATVLGREPRSFVDEARDHRAAFATGEH